MEPSEIEELWDDLLAFIEQRRVIPVLGAELLNIQQNGAAVPLYRAVAEQLLNKYELSGSGLHDGQGLEVQHELSDAVRALARDHQSKVRVSQLYRPVHDILKNLVAEQQDGLPCLRQLASIQDFNLFATTTPDNLLVQALNSVRFDGNPQTEEIEYAPKLPTDRRRDIPEVLTSRYTGVFYLFGKADVSSFYAIHDEDSLEFAYTLQAGNGPERMFQKLRNSNLLFIGCTFAAWLSPFFLRSSNLERLFSDHRSKKEFLVGKEATRDQAFVVFLQHFSQDTRCYPIDPWTFVDELYQRWSKRNPAAIAPLRGEKPSKSGETIFISYSSDDIGAARALNEGLSEIGADVAWFDKAALKPGDEWQVSIRSAIQHCTFFLPLISDNTERRDEAFFREEWLQAVERQRKIQGRKFIFPVVIDHDFDQNMARYSRVPDQFAAWQYSHAPAGKMNLALKEELQTRLRDLRRGRAA